MLAHQVQTLIHTLFPPSCLGCQDIVASDYGLCPKCWNDLPLISGPVCKSCGVPVLAEEDDTTAQCEDCLTTERPWHQGRAAMEYTGMARKLVQGLRHYDRFDVATAAARWLAQSAEPLLTPDTIIAAVPLHWTRLMQRRYNQSAMLALALGQTVLRRTIMDLLIRTERTGSLDGLSQDRRFARMSGVIAPNPKHLGQIAGAHILLVDDTMVSGATFDACTRACLAAGAKRVDVLALARAGRAY